jgi:hypothetical protein
VGGLGSCRSRGLHNRFNHILGKEDDEMNAKVKACGCKLLYRHLITWDGNPPYRGLLYPLDSHLALIATLYSPWGVML